MQKVIGRPSMLGYSVLRIHHLKRKRISQPRLKMERVEIIQLQEKTANNVGKDKMEKKTREIRVNQTYFNLRLTVGILARPFKGHRQSTQKKTQNRMYG